MKKYWITFSIFITLATIVTTYIIVSSCLNGSASSSQSGVIVDSAKEVINTISPNTINESNIKWFSNFIRKLVGHFGLFMVDSIFVSLSIYFFNKVKNQNIYLPQLYIGLSFGLFLAILTEVIQLMVPQRSGQFRDVLIDFSGFLVGIGLLLLIYFLIDRHHKKIETIA